MTQHHETPASEPTTNFSELLKAYWNDEGWHRLYKKYGGAVLAKENYRWKRIVMKRFGPNRKAALRSEIMNGKSLYQRLGIKPNDDLKGIAIPMRF